MISHTTAVTLTDYSKRSIWRHLSNGVLKRANCDPSKIDIDSLTPYLCVPLDAEERLLVIAADQGDAQAQTDLALTFLQHGKTKPAIYWLEQAAAQDDAEAMYWLGRCHTDGLGLARSDDLGIMWVAKAAALGHLIAQAQMAALKLGFTQARSASP